MEPKADTSATEETDHKKIIDDDGTTKLSTQEAVMDTKLADETHLRLFTEDVLDSRQQEIECRETEKHKLATKLNALKKELNDTQRQLVEARNQNKSKTKQLQDAQDQIFRLQPRRTDITEAEAQQAYKCLCGNIERWVEHRLKGVLTSLDLGQLSTPAVPSQAMRFVALIRGPAKRCLDVDETDEYHVMSAIMNYLYLSLFSKSFYCPLDDNSGDHTLKWIDELETTMSQLPRDRAHCREWRSETLTALTSQPSFKARRASHTQLLAESLTLLLSVLVPNVPPSELVLSIRRNIVDPASDLAHQLHLASNIFSLKWPVRSAASRLENYECINVANGGLILDLTGTTSTSPSRRKTTYLFDVFPGLFVERIEHGKRGGPKAITKPTVAVHNDEGGIIRCPTVMKWLWDSSGGPRPAPRASAVNK